MKSQLSISALIVALGFAGPASAVMIDLDVLDTDIMAGETFSVEVLVNGQGIGEDLLAFGFDVKPTGGSISYLGYTIASGFTDFSDPFNPANVSGAAFPGVSDDDVLLATLAFNADAAGSDVVSIEGLFDGLFYGLIYEITGEDILAAADINVSETVAMPEPYTLALMGIGLAGIGCARRKPAPEDTTSALRPGPESLIGITSCVFSEHNEPGLLLLRRQGSTPSAKDASAFRDWELAR
jgi:hypothetical protein